MVGSESADALEERAHAAWWNGDTDEALRLRTQAFDAFVTESRPSEAAMSAVLLAIFHFGRGDQPLATGWMGRASELAEHLPEGRVHGYLILLTEVEPRLMAGQATEAVEAARRLRELGRRVGDPDIAALGLHSEGRGLMAAGQVNEGLKLIDEAMVEVAEGALTLFMSGTLYCHTIASCQQVSELDRMLRWQVLAEQWAPGASAAIFSSLCAVHRAQLHVLHGEWEQAERAALAVLPVLDSSRVDYAAEAWYAIAEARRLRGDRSAAAAYDEAHARGRDPQPGRALLQLQQGDAERAAVSIRSALAAAGPDPLRRAPVCAAAVEILTRARQLDEAHDATDELRRTAERYATSGLAAMAQAAQGTVLLAQGDAAGALPVLRAACQRWLELGASYEAAQVCVRLAEAYRDFGDEASATAEMARAESTFRRLGAGRGELPDGLTRREAEVLRLLASGRSNSDIADALVISDRTVARHLTNAYRKIGVTSRTQAARYAADHGLTG